MEEFLTSSWLYRVLVVFGELVLVAGFLAWVDRWKRDAAEKAEKVGRAEVGTAKRIQTNWKMIWLGILGITLLVIVAPWEVERVHTFIQSPFGIATIVVGAVLVFIIWVSIDVWLHFRKWRQFRRIETLALQGDVETAISEVQKILKRAELRTAEAIVVTAVRYITSLEGMRGNWTVCLELIEQLKPRDPLQDKFLAHQVLALWHTGKTNEASSVLQDRIPEEWIGKLTAGLFFANTGSTAEAREILASIDQFLLTKVYAPQLPMFKMVQSSLRQLMHGDEMNSEAATASRKASIDAAIRAILTLHCNAFAMSMANWELHQQQSTATSG